MAETKRLPAKKRYDKKNRNPMEVIVYDILQREFVIAEHRYETKVVKDEIKVIEDVRIYKVYHPAFEGGFRWVRDIVKKLGTFIPDALVTE